MRFLKLFLILPFVFFQFITDAQIPVGKWREHFSYKEVHCLADAGNKIYAASELAVFSYHKNEGTIEKLSKVNGLSDAGIERIAYHNELQSLIILYKNSNIDIVVNNTVYNLSELKRKQISSDKTVYNVLFNENLAYLSCGFGIVVLDIERMEFKDTYYIGENAAYVKVNDIAINNGYIYAATDNGLYSAFFEEQLLSDYRNWTLSENLPGNNFKYNIIHQFSNRLFANQINPDTEADTLYELNNGSWQISTVFQYDGLRSITDNGSNIVFTVKSRASSFDSNFNQASNLNWYIFSNEDISTWTSMNYALIDENGDLYIGDQRFGLVYTDQTDEYYIYPNGPEDNKTAKVITSNNRVYTTNGNNNSKAWYSPLYNYFSNEAWNSHNVGRDTAFNFFSLAVNPQNSNNLFVGSWGYGIFEFLNNEWVNHYYPGNSSLQYISTYGYGYSRISSLAFDSNNNLWISNQDVGEPISVKTNDGDWKSFNFDGLITNLATEDIIVTENNNKWVLLEEGKGVLVFDDNGTPLNEDDDVFKKFSPQIYDGDNFSSIYAAEQDKDGNLWLGTEEGIIVYFNPEDVFEDDFYADRIQLTSYGNDTTEQYLLSTDIVSDIETDGANRKWIATRNSGVFLVSENGKEEILNFNQYNSPLISNTIVDLDINHHSGELFILTDKGILSYRSDATSADDVFGDVYVFPNPVRPGYDGVITVTGLADEVNVKFTDISGNVVYETDALGGQAVWDGKTFNGRKVSSGIYLVFCSNEDGSQTLVTKFLFMN